MTAAIDLVGLGWTDAMQEELQRSERPLTPARVAVEHKNSYVLLGESGEMPARASGRLAHHARQRSDLPAVGDWVGITESGDQATIHSVLPRRSAFSRKVAGTETEQQIVAANIDVVFICTAFGPDLNLRRVERYLTLTWESGALPVVVLTKADLAEDPSSDLAECRSIAIGADVWAVSAHNGEGVDQLRMHIGSGRTVALLGSSGVGKSTLVNRLLDNDVMATAAVRWDGKGRHTTTYRRLIPIPGGGALLDTPGMRELQMWDADDGLENTFVDVDMLASGCRFRDCSHTSEPGCAVKDALGSGELEPARFASYRKQERELAALARRRDKRLAAEESKRWTKVYKEARSRSRHR